MTEHRKYIARALELARKGKFTAHPNPMVGCVIVKGGRIVAEAAHMKYGGPHAEAAALKKAGKLARGATLYVNLEPCSHYGKTPPCAEAIIKAGIRKIVASVGDPNPIVSGQGFALLKSAGIDVKTGTMRNEAEELNRKFFYAMKNRRSFVALKMAQTLDGKIADSNKRSRWITSTQSRRLAHELRAEYDAVLVGKGTLLADDPLLTARGVKGRQPWRLVLDGHLNSKPSSRIFNEGTSPALILTSEQALRAKPKNVRRFENNNVALVACGKNPRLNAATVLSATYRLGINSILVEGGSSVHSWFLQSQAAQYLYAFIAPAILGGGLPGVSLFRPRTVASPYRLTRSEVHRIGSDILIEGFIKYNGRDV